jgi:molybdopterin synthase sulfur carrier subunit
MWAMKILYFASLRDRLGRSEDVVTLDTKTSIKVFLKKHLGQDFFGVASGKYLFAVNEEVVPDETELSDGDTLAVFPPFSGGV